MRILSFVIGLFALIGFLFVGGLVTAVVVATRTGPELPSSVVLELVLDGGTLSDSASGGLKRLVGGDDTLEDLLTALERARTDPRVKGLIARLGSEGPDMAQVQELRGALDRFRASGRFALVYATDYGNASYLLASAFDEVWMQPFGLFALTGPAAEVPFARAALDAAGLLPEVERREAYKSAPNSATEAGFTPAHREMTEALVGDLARQLAEGVAASRRLDPAAVRALIDRAPLTDREALDAKLIDHLGYRDEMEARADERSNEAEFVDLGDYLRANPPPAGEGTVIATVEASGSIVDGEDEDGATGKAVITPGRLVAAIGKAADDDEVKAILLRIDSGGGSASASESIRRAIVKAREAGKKVVVSMGSTAASGGYWIAMSADHILADPATLTGSIGVFAGKVSGAALSERLGIAWGRVSGGKNAAMWSPLHPFSESERERLKAFTDQIYEGFVAKVAEARRLPPDAVRAVAQGRVWTGAQALDRGLVDELGGREEAVMAIRSLTGLAPDAPVRLVPFPEPPSPLEEALAFLSQDGGWLRAVRVLAAMPGLERWLGVVRAVADGAGTGVSAQAPRFDIR
jgi:protease IV